jgi:hypothetical protein
MSCPGPGAAAGNLLEAIIVFLLHFLVRGAYGNDYDREKDRNLQKVRSSGGVRA